MKKIVLAPAVALAFTGLVASPVAAAESPSTQSSDSAEAKAKKAEAEKAKKAEAEKAEKEKAEAEKKAEEKAAAEKEAAEKAAKEKAEKEKAEAEKKAADKAAKEKTAEEKAAKDKAAEDKSSDEKKDDPKPAPSPKDDDEGENSDEAEELNASLKLSTQSIKAEDLAEDGLRVTVTNLEKGDKVSVSGGDLTADTTTASGSSANLTLKTNEDAEDIAAEQSVSLQVQRTGVAPQSLTDSVSVQSSDDEDEVDPIDASLTVDPEEITAEDLADEGKGVEVTVSGVKKGDRIKDSLTGKTETAEADGDHVLHVWWDGNPDSLEAGEVPFEVTIDREGTESETLKGTINVVDDTEVDPSVKLESKKITLEGFKKDGLEFTGSGFSPNGTVSVQGEAISTQRAASQADELTADEDGNVHGVVTAPESLEVGTYALTFIDDVTGETTDAVEVTVTEDEDAVDPIDASLTVDPEEITAEDLADEDKGVEVTVSGVKQGDRIKDSLTGKTETAEADGDHVLHVWWDGNPDSLEVGEVPFDVTIDREGTESETLKGTINVVDDGETEAPAEASLTVSPKTIEAADFANEEKGVTLAVENCEPGQDVHFEVNPKGINVTAYENTVKADDEGRASVNVFGTSSDASAYVGSYTATATCGDDTMKDSFKVTEGADSGGDTGNGDNGSAGNDDGSQLPRTGADLGGLTTGALLLLVGGAAIAITGRKNKFGQTPTSF